MKSDLKPGTLIKLHESTRRCGNNASKPGMVVSYDTFGQYNVLIEGKIVAYHTTQIGETLLNPAVIE